MRSITVLLSLLSLAAGCKRHAPPPRVLEPRTVSIQVEVYDPVTNRVWENVDVRVVEAEAEWSGLVVPNPDPDAWTSTDRYGTAYFTARDLGDAQVGFVEDVYGRALLEPDHDADEAFVLLEIWAPGFDAVLAEVRLTWSKPDAFVSVPFR